MTKLKTICVLMLAVTVCIWSANAAVEKQLVQRSNPVISTNVAKEADVSVHSAVNYAASPNSIELIENAKEVSFSDAKAELDLQLKKANAAFVKNPDGTLTAAFRAVRDSKGTATSVVNVLAEMAFVPGGVSPPWNCYLGYYTPTPIGGMLAPAFYYDISLLPASATITDVTVDLSIMPLGTFPTQPALFDINDLTEIYTDTPDNYTAVEEDIRNVGGGNTYISETTGLAVSGTYNYDLGTQAEVDMTARIAASETIFAIGLHPLGMVGTDGFWLMDPDQGATPSVLYVTFDAPGNNPIITSVTATPASIDNIGMDTTTFEVLWTDADDHDIGEFGMIFNVRTSYNEEMQLSGGVWEKTGTGTYRWYGEWDPAQDQQIGGYDLSVLMYDGTFTDLFDYTAGDDLLTITSPAIEYADFNTDGPLSQWPAGWVDSPVTDPGPPAIGWQYSYLWTGTEDYIAYAHNTDAAQDCTLTSPVVDMSAAATAHLFFDCLWEGTPTNFTLEGSIDGFTTVADSLELTTAVAADELQVLNWDMTSWAAGEAAVQIRFHFVAPATPTAGAIFDVVQFVTGDAILTVNDTAITPATTAVIDGDEMTFSVDFTGSTTATVDDFTFDVYLQSDVGTQQALLTGLTNGDIYGSVITENAPGDFTATVSGLEFQPGIEIGVYDLMGYASDGIDWDYDEFTDNEDVLTLTTPSFWYEDFNEGAAVGPTGWSILSLPGGEDGDDWYYDFYTGTGDYFGFILYDAEADPQNEVMRTATIDCTGMVNCKLYYSYEWASGYDPTATGEVRISNDGGASFTTIHTHTAPAAPEVESGLLKLDIASYADGENDVVVEFRYIATDDFYWSVDIVQIFEEEIRPIPATGPIGLGLLLAALGGLIIRRRK